MVGVPEAMPNYYNIFIKIIVKTLAISMVVPNLTYYLTYYYTIDYCNYYHVANYDDWILYSIISG
jgi:hypothetical protein